MGVFLMNWEANWNYAISETYVLSVRTWRIPPGGYLLAISVQEATPFHIPRDGNLHWKAEYEITDTEHIPQYGSFKWEYPMSSAGIAFKEPLINLNTTHGYILHRIRPVEDTTVKVTVTHTG
jgi:hypothetical protein